MKQNQIVTGTTNPNLKNKSLNDKYRVARVGYLPSINDESNIFKTTNIPVDLNFKD